MPILYFDGWYTPKLCQQYPNHIFVFGDNARRVGTGGQAAIRHEPNVHGIATKRAPSMAESSFFYDGDSHDRVTVDRDLSKLRHYLEKGVDCVIPIEKASGLISLGLERARLRETAPSLYGRISEMIRSFGTDYGEGRFVPDERT